MLIDKYRIPLRAPEAEGGAEAPPADDAGPADGAAQGQPQGGEGAAKPKVAGEQPPQDAAPKRRSAETVFSDRIGEVTRHRRNAERERDEAIARGQQLENELRAAQELLRGNREPERPAAHAASPDDFLNTPEGRRAVEQRARDEARAADIIRRGDEIYDAAAKEYGQAKVDKALGNFRSFDGLRVELAEALFNVPDSHKVLYEIGNNPDTIDRLYKLADTNPIAMAVEVAKIASNVGSKPAARRVSEVPEPPDIVNGRGNAGPADLNDKDLPMSKWVEEREKDLKKRGVRL